MRGSNIGSTIILKKKKKKGPFMQCFSFLPVEGLVLMYFDIGH